MLCSKFELISITIGIFINFKVAPNAMYCIVVLVECVLAHLACFVRNPAYSSQ